VVAAPFHNLKTHEIIERSSEFGIAGVVIIYDSPIEANGFYTQPVIKYFTRT
jgi:hypothetical protein